MKKLKTISIDIMIDKYLGKKGSLKRDTFEKKLSTELLHINKRLK